MTDNEILTVLIDISKATGGCVWLLWGVFLLKKYAINGTIDRFSAPKQLEVDDVKGLRELVTTLVNQHDSIVTQYRNSNVSND